MFANTGTADPAKVRVSRANRHSAHPEHGGGDVGEGQVVSGEPVEPCGEAAEALEPVEAALDAVAEFVDQRVVRDRGEGMTVSAPICLRSCRRLPAS